MVRVLIAGILALMVSIALGPRFIRFQRKREYGQQIREEGPKHHAVKQGTPTAGGLLIVASMLVAFLSLSRYTPVARIVFLCSLACGRQRPLAS